MLSLQLYCLFINNQGVFIFEVMENCPVWQNHQHCPEWYVKGSIGLWTLMSSCSFVVPWSIEESLIQYGSCILVKPECKHISLLTVMFLWGLMSLFTTGVATRSEAGEYQSHLENKIIIESGLKMFFFWLTVEVKSGSFTQGSEECDAEISNNILCQPGAKYRGLL